MRSRLCRVLCVVRRPGVLVPQERDEETREMVHQIKLLTGLSNDDPPDSKWIKMEKTNRQSGKVVSLSLENAT